MQINFQRYTKKITYASSAHFFNKPCLMPYSLWLVKPLRCFLITYSLYTVFILSVTTMLFLF